MFKKISDFATRLKYYRTQKDLTLAEMESLTKVPNQTLSRYELNQRVPKYDVAVKIAESLGVNPLWLLGYDVGMYSDIDLNNYDNVYPLKTKKVRLLGAIACGEPMWVDEQYGEYVIVNGDVAADFALRCQGDSMIGARIYDGDIVFIRQQPQVENGEIAAVVIDETATLKRVYRYDDYISLNAENPAYPPIILREGDADEIRILGKAIAFQSYVR